MRHLRRPAARQTALLLAGIATLVQPTAARAVQDPVVLFLGDSLTAGYGLQPDEAFPALVQERIDDARLGFRVVNAGVSGETSAGGLRRVDWLLRQPIAVLVLELGANDGLRGTPIAGTRANLQGIIDRVRDVDPTVEIVLAGMQVPPNLGAEYTGAFRGIFPDLAGANDAHLIPFLLEGVGGRAELNLADGIHPNADGHRIVAANVWRVLEPLLRGLAAGQAIDKASGAG